MGYGTTNLDALQEVLSLWIRSNLEPQQPTGQSTVESSQFVCLTEEQAITEKLYITSKTALNKLSRMSNIHGKVCNGELKMIEDENQQSGFWNCMFLKCSQGKDCQVYPARGGSWGTSAYLPDGRTSYVNKRMVHAFYTSGPLPSEFQNLFKAANVAVSSRFTWNLYQQHDYKDIIHLVRSY